jgi:transposase
MVYNNLRMAKKGRRATNEERLRAIQLLENGYSADAVADILEVGRSSIFAWQEKYGRAAWPRYRRNSRRDVRRRCRISR